MKKVISFLILGVMIMSGVVANAATSAWVDLRAYPTAYGPAYSYSYFSYSTHRAQIRTHWNWASEYWISSSDWVTPGNTASVTVYSNCPLAEGRGEC